MSEGGYYQPPRPRRTSIAIVVLIHCAAIATVASSRIEVTKVIRPPTDVTWIKTPEPPPENETHSKPQKARKELIYRNPIVDVPVDTPIDAPTETIEPPHFNDVTSFNGTGDGTLVEPVPPPDPIPIEARLDRRSELQPPYPASEQRMGAEGTVSLKVLIGPDGRVKAAERLRATSEAFYQATLRHAIRKWRFEPAMIDGRPVESSKVMTVRFEIES
ncbi:energy transducer TonB [Sphingosinicella rhizophila]|uniref:TonB family protein n=1 Tax=Sphingosinicella rhizophila TaxID=3050082 RepID=A0ABU3Q952_9SPHN|nr:TonB family protein [Sphingosinicella sp. GR2756]MDT9599518.1 TonB family protein [Sphingosinicella sp. GR2756]